MAIGCGYIAMLHTLPERIEVRRIVMEGSGTAGVRGAMRRLLSATGIWRPMGRTEDMNKRIAQAEKEALEQLNYCHRPNSFTRQVKLNRHWRY